MLSLRDPVAPPFRHLIRQPAARVRDMSNRSHDLSMRVCEVLAGVEYLNAPEDPLHRMLVRALAQSQSGAYIQAVPNDAAIEVAALLRTDRGAINTAPLLNAVLQTRSS